MRRKIRNRNHAEFRWDLYKVWLRAYGCEYICNSVSFHTNRNNKRLCFLPFNKTHKFLLQLPLSPSLFQIIHAAEIIHHIPCFAEVDLFWESSPCSSASQEAAAPKGSMRHEQEREGKVTLQTKRNKTKRMVGGLLGRPDFPMTSMKKHYHQSRALFLYPRRGINEKMKSLQNREIKDEIKQWSAHACI
jgi:hypothetical protein